MFKFKTFSDIDTVTADEVFANQIAFRQGLADFVVLKGVPRDYADGLVETAIEFAFIHNNSMKNVLSDAKRTLKTFTKSIFKVELE